MRKTTKQAIYLGYLLATYCILGINACTDPTQVSETDSELVQAGFPWDIPQTKPDRPLSAAMERLYDNYLTQLHIYSYTVR